MTSLVIEKLNETFLRIACPTDKGIEYDLYDRFTFSVPGAKFTPAYKNKIWDGKIHLYQLHTKTLYLGLLNEVKKFAKERSLDIEYRNIDSFNKQDQSITPELIKDFVDGLKLSARGELLEVRDYQYHAIWYGIYNERALMLSPTSCLHGDTSIDVITDKNKIQYSFKELYEKFHKENFEFNIYTPDGPKKVIDAHKKYGPGNKVTFNDGTVTIGSSYHLVLFNDEFVTLESLRPGDVLFSTDTIKTVVSNESIPDDFWYDFSLDYEHECYIQNDIIHHNSGKSSIIYSIMRWHIQNDRRIMIIVPTTNLVEQLFSDFKDYSSFNGFNVDDHVQKLYSGQSKEFTKDVLITTFQSIMRWTQADFTKLNIGCVMVDECHQAKAKSITGILERLVNTRYRIGLTGTLDGSKTNELVIQGLTGPIHKVTTTKKLMDDGHVSELKIKCIVIKYPDEYKKASKNLKYADEISFLVSHKPRNKIICDLALSCKGNTLILFQLVEKHGKLLYEQLINRVGNRKVYFISGDTNPEERERIRKEIENDNNAIIVGSYQTVATGVNIPSIENVIFASPSKSRIRNLQSIGRGLRLKDGKSHCNLFDIADDLSWKKHTNFTLKHFVERVKIYSEEKFSFKMFDYQL